MRQNDPPRRITVRESKAVVAACQDEAIGSIVRNLVPDAAVSRPSTHPRGCQPSVGDRLPQLEICVILPEIERNCCCLTAVPPLLPPALARVSTWNRQAATARLAIPTTAGISQHPASTGGFCMSAMRAVRRRLPGFEPYLYQRGVEYRRFSVGESGAKLVTSGANKNSGSKQLGADNTANPGQRIGAGVCLKRG